MVVTSQNSFPNLCDVSLPPAPLSVLSSDPIPAICEDLLLNYKKYVLEKADDAKLDKAFTAVTDHYEASLLLLISQRYALASGFYDINIARDILQEVYFNISKNILQYDESSGDPGRYVRTIALNKTRDFSRKIKHKVFSLNTEAGSKAGQNLAPKDIPDKKSNRPDEEAIFKEQNQRTQELVGKILAYDDSFKGEYGTPFKILHELWEGKERKDITRERHLSLNEYKRRLLKERELAQRVFCRSYSKLEW